MAVTVAAMVEAQMGLAVEVAQAQAMAMSGLEVVGWAAGTARDVSVSVAAAD